MGIAADHTYSLADTKRSASAIIEVSAKKAVIISRLKTPIATILPFPVYCRLASPYRDRYYAIFWTFAAGFAAQHPNTHSELRELLCRRLCQIHILLQAAWDMNIDPDPISEYAGDDPLAIIDAWETCGRFFVPAIPEDVSTIDIARAESDLHSAVEIAEDGSPVAIIDEDDHPLSVILNLSDMLILRGRETDAYPKLLWDFFAANIHALLQTEIPSDPAFIALQFYAIASLIVECETDGIELGEFETRVLMMLSYPERFAQYLHRRERIKPPTLH